ncbi:MAG TPA: ABC transporter ATP-binding protein [Bryobacteraceae bacterium]|nr:ABC transporter ATP-binding protein [Bryobacteraceae bacterium]
MSRFAVEVIGVAKRFGKVAALDGIHLTIRPNEFVSLLGPSGCGKSTLLRIVAGFEFPTTGRVLIHGKDTTRVPPERRPTNIVFQRGALFPHMNVFDNIAYSLKLRKWPKPRIAAKVEEMLSLVHLENLGHRGATELSGGQIQRAALARALAAEPSVLLLDEPLSALDLKLRQQMQIELRAIQRKLRATFLFVTHDQTEALVMSDRIAIMNEGRIIQEGTPQEVYTRPVSAFASGFIGETNLLQGIVVSTEDLVVTLAVGEEGHFRAKTSLPLAPGTRVTLSVRPEAIRVGVRESSGNGQGMLGHIGEVVYLGSRIRIGAVTRNGAVVWADLRDDEAEGLKAGTPVVLSWAPSAASVWAESSD